MSETPSSTVHAAEELESSWLNDPLNYLVKGFIAFLQTIWEEAPRGCFHWAAAIEETELVITEENPVNLEATEQRPAISVVLGPARFNGSSLDDLVNVDLTNAKEIHTDLIPGTMTLNCLSRVRQECRFLGWQSARTIWNLRKIFIKETHIHEVGRNITIGAVTPAGQLVQGDTEGEWHNVPVSVPFFLQWTDSVTPLKEDWNRRPIHTLQHMSVRLRTRMGLAQPNLTHTQDRDPPMLWGEAAGQTQASQKAARSNVLRPPRIRGRVINTATPTGPGSSSVPIVDEHKVD
jgi:hypothetical protein